MNMIEMSTMDHIPGYKITKNCGIVFGSKILNRALEGDGNLDIEQLLDSKRQDAMALTVEQAMRRHADAIINVRFTTTNIGHNMIECQVSGMAVQVAKIDE